MLLALQNNALTEPLVEAAAVSTSVSSATADGSVVSSNQGGSFLLGLPRFGRWVPPRPLISANAVSQATSSSSAEATVERSAMAVSVSVSQATAAATVTSLHARSRSTSTASADATVVNYPRLNRHRQIWLLETEQEEVLIKSRRAA